jgi:hypothetical protein
MKFISVPVAACGLIAAAFVPAGNASGSPCDGPDCVPNVTRNVVQSAPCVLRTQYRFGMDAYGNTLFCVSETYAGGTQERGEWAASTALIGVRDPGAPCYGNGGAAQSLDGTPMICLNQIWAAHYG